VNCKILLIAGSLDPSVSFEYCYLQQPLERLTDNFIAFDFVASLQREGRSEMNQNLLGLVKRERPDIAIFVPQTDQFLPEVVDEISRHTLTVGYFFDDMWRIEYSRFWASHFTFVTTSDVNGVRKFRDAGFDNAIFSPFGCNELIYCRKDLPKLYDVSFVGQYHPYREWYLAHLKEAGISVRVWGMGGWPSGLLKTDQIVEVFNQSRINLNLSNSVSWDARYLMTLDRPVKSTFRAWRDTFYALRKSGRKVREQVKARHFEINACGGFQLSYYVEGLERHYRIGDEIAVYASPEELVEKVQYYLRHESEREKIAQRGYERTLRDHTMKYRLEQVLRAIGFSESGILSEHSR